MLVYPPSCVAKAGQGGAMPRLVVILPRLRRKTDEIKKKYMAVVSAHNYVFFKKKLTVLGSFIRFSLWAFAPPRINPGYATVPPSPPQSRL